MRAIYLIARREFLSYVATWGFWLSLASMPLFMGLGIGIPFLIESSQPTRYYVLVDETGGTLEQAVFEGAEASRLAEQERALQAITELVGESPQIEAALASQTLENDGGRYVRITPDSTALDELRPFLTGDALVSTPDGEQSLFAAIYLRGNAVDGIEIEYWSTNLTDAGLRSQFRSSLRDYMQQSRLRDAGISAELIETVNALSPTVRELNPLRTEETAEITVAERIPLVVGAAFAFGLWMVIFSVVNMLLTAMIEEKGNKILDMMLASCRHHEILIGKLLGVAMVSATLLLTWGTLAIGSGVTLQQFASAADLPVSDILAAVLDPGLILPAVGYFIIGYMMYGAIFLAIGSLCETLQDAQSLMSPILLVMMAPLFIIMTAFDSPDSPVVEIASWVPVWTPFIMLARLPLDPPMFDVVGTTVVMLTTALIVTWGAGRLFRMGALNHANQDTIKRWFSFGKKKPASEA